MNNPKNTDLFGIIFIAYIFLIVSLDATAQTFSCPCPEGGIYKLGNGFPDTLSGKISQKDFKAEINKACWDFGDSDQIPDDGWHPYDKYEFKVSSNGDYSISGSDNNNKMIVVVYKANSAKFPLCGNIILGAGGYVEDGTHLYFEEPQDNGRINNTVSLDTAYNYGLIILDYDTDFRGEYSVSINPVGQGNVYFSKAVYSEDCTFNSCIEDTANFDIPIPDVPSGMIFIHMAMFVNKF